jgi:hypothetical protein
MPGPTPKPAGQRRRRNAPLANTLKLPAKGRQGRPPRWPLPPEVARQATLAHLRDQEVTVRAELEVTRADGDQEKAQALDDKASRLRERAVALEAEIKATREAQALLWRELWHTPQAVAWERLGWTREAAQYVLWKVRAEQGSLEAAKEARQQADRLGLSPLAMLRLRWEVDADEVAEQRDQRQADAQEDLRARLRVVE